LTSTMDRCAIRGCSWCDRCTSAPVNATRHNYHPNSGCAKITRVLLSVTVMLCLMSSGCGSSRPETAPVSGRVTYQGRPVPSGRIAFQPEEGRLAIGAIDSDGHFSLTTFKPGDGALLGKHRVTIEATRLSGGDPLPKNRQEELRVGGGVPPVVEQLVPEKYSRLETTPLKAEVSRGSNTVNFDLPAAP
jgi:hypothetical protein